MKEACDILRDMNSSPRCTPQALLFMEHLNFIFYLYTFIISSFIILILAKYQDFSFY